MKFATMLLITSSLADAGPMSQCLNSISFSTQTPIVLGEAQVLIEMEFPRRDNQITERFVRFVSEENGGLDLRCGFNLSKSNNDLYEWTSSSDCDYRFIDSLPDAKDIVVLIDFSAPKKGEAGYYINPRFTAYRIVDGRRYQIDSKTKLGGVWSNCSFSVVRDFWTP